MEPTVVVSDIHGNIEALEVVLAHIDRLGLERIYCLGDTVGYGPNPVECLRLARERCTVLLMGNHEYAAVEPNRMMFNPGAARALAWTRERLAAAGELESLRELPMAHHEHDALFVHGSVRDPLAEYVTETDSRGLSRFREVTTELEEDFTTFRICFVGHNHKPFLATAEGFIHPHDNLSEFTIAGEKLYVCVGSVGQPRDGDPRACFAVFDGERVRYHRVAYPTEVTARKVAETDLPGYLGERLLSGR